MKDEEEVDGQLDMDTPVPSSTDVDEDSCVDIASPTMLYNYFSNIDQYKKAESQETLVNDFRNLMTPVVQGHKPTVIEEAQLRQAALKANISLDYVDAFVDFVKDENPELVRNMSLKEKPVSWEEVEDLDEDDAIAAFLSSTKSSDENVQEEEETHKNQVGSPKPRSPRQKELTEISSDGSQNHEAPVTSSKDSELETKSSRSGEDSEDESDFSGSESSEDYFSRREETRSETNASDGIEESVMSGDDSVDMEMLKGCQSIESYDEGIWQRRSAMATYGWGWEEATWLSSKGSPRGAPNLAGDGINRVTPINDASNFLFNKKSFPLTRKKCKLSYARRVKSHEGFLDVDVYSLQECAAVGEENQFRDETPWELRRVRQRFLHERSLSFSRNWFGHFVETSGNDKIKAPICKPKSMEMPMRKIPDPGDWTPEWYTTWGGRKLLLRKPSCESSVDSGSDSDSSIEKDYNDKDSLISFASGSSYDDDEEDFEDAPECGTFVNTKQKIGEHVTRVHPDYTSSLRRSRWRKKYFPIGTFPY